MRELVDGSRADETAYLGETVGVRKQFPFGISFVGHGLELDDFEDLTTFAGTLLKEKSAGAFVGEVQPDGHCGQWHAQDE